MDPTIEQLLTLPAAKKSKLCDLIRTGADLEIIHEFLPAEMRSMTQEQLHRFFEVYAASRWTRCLDVAALEADVIQNLARRYDDKIPEAVLTVLGQTVFTKVTSGQVDIGELTKFAALLLRGREANRADRALEITAEKADRAHRTTTERALEAFARELPQQPDALAAFENLRDQLLPREPKPLE